MDPTTPSLATSVSVVQVKYRYHVHHLPPSSLAVAILDEVKAKDPIGTYRLIPGPFPETQTLAEYETQYCHYAIVKDYQMDTKLDQILKEYPETKCSLQRLQNSHQKLQNSHQKLKASTEEVQVSLKNLKKKERLNEQRALILGLGNLHNAARRKINGKLPRSAKRSKKENMDGHDLNDAKDFCSEKLKDAIMGLKAKDLEKITNGILGADDLRLLKNQDWSRKRNEIAHENWDQLADILMEKYNAALKQNWDPIFFYVTGSHIEQHTRTDSELELISSLQVFSDDDDDEVSGEVTGDGENELSEDFNI